MLVMAFALVASGVFVSEVGVEGARLRLTVQLQSDGPATVAAASPPAPDKPPAIVSPLPKS